MVIQSLTVQWQEAAIRGYDPNRHGLESPEAERANRNRNNQFKQIKEQHSEENVRKNGDGALEFERGDHLAGTYKYSDETMARFDDFKEEYEKSSNILREIFDEELEKARRQYERDRENYETAMTKGIMLSSGDKAFLSENRSFYDQSGNHLPEELQDEAWAKYDPEKNNISHEERSRLKTVVDNSMANVEFYKSASVELTELDKRVKELSEKQGHIPEDEFNKQTDEIERDFERLKSSLPPDVTAKFEQKLNKLKEPSSPDIKPEEEFSSESEISSSALSALDSLDALPATDSSYDVVKSGNVQTDISARKVFIIAATAQNLSTEPVPNALEKDTVNVNTAQNVQNASPKYS